MRGINNSFAEVLNSASPVLKTKYINPLESIMQLYTHCKHYCQSGTEALFAKLSFVTLRVSKQVYINIVLAIKIISEIA